MFTLVMKLARCAIFIVIDHRFREMFIVFQKNL